jgi:anti-sigma-K factor RskA
MNLSDPEDRAVACAEFVLGTLDDADRSRLLAAMEEDESLQREVGFWQDRLLSLYKDVAPVEPTADVWHQVDAALDREPIPASDTSPFVPPAAILPEAARRRKNKNARLWQRLGFWRGLSGLSMVFALLLSLLFIMRLAEPPEATYVAVLQSAEKQVAWIVKIDRTGPVKIAPLSDLGPIPKGKAWELWTKGKDVSSPTSLGLLEPGPNEIPREVLPYLEEDQLFEVSLEPEGGSPTGKPTGPVLSIGATQRI